MADGYVINSYRYLRLALVVVTLTLGISLVLEIIAANCYQGSISAFYYTPVHSIFIGSLFVIGVSLVALIGRDLVEDLFFNLAGFLAPIVALVPTARPTDLCGPSERFLGISEAVPDEEATQATTNLLVTNNAWALFLGFLAAFLVALYLATRSTNRMDRLRQVSRATWVGLGLSFLVLIIGVIWFLTWRTSFDRRAHGASAVLMFVAIWLAVMVNADFDRLRPIVRLPYKWLKAEPPTYEPGSRHETFYRGQYKLIAIFMAVAGVVLGIGVAIGVDKAVFWLEVAEIVPFGYFWVLQTAEGWTTVSTSPEGVPPAPEAA
jgi:hypothetical protein